MNRNWGRGLLAGAAVLTLAVVAAPPPAHATSGGVASWLLRRAVTADGVTTHLAEFQRIADRKGGSRASGGAGYDASVAYAEKVFRRAGYRVTRQAFEFRAFLLNSPSVLTQVAPAPVPGGDLPHRILSYSGSADVTAPASVPAGDAQGCAPGDFGPANAGTVVLVSRGTCPFAQKATNAADAGAAAVVLYNNTSGDLAGTLGNTFALDFAAVGVTQKLGQELVARVPTGLTLRVRTDTIRKIASTENLFAESRWGDPRNVVMAGAHLDSVAEGPGINDNGSGSATLLEIATQLRQLPTRNRVRFALWGAEEAGLVGSTHYIANLPTAEREKIALYLNFDMVGSPNYVRFVFDGDNSAFPPGTGSAVGPPGSGAIERLFHDYFATQGLHSAETPFSGRSDYGPFIAPGVDIPSGGLFTGSEGIKTAEQAAAYGGTAGEAYDACYHRACDTVGNVSRRAIDELSDAVAHAIITYAYDTSGLSRPPTRPASGTTAPAGEGGGLHDHDEVPA